MRLFKLLAAMLAITIAGWSVPAAAQATANPATIAAALQRAGLPAKINTPTDGSPPYIESSKDGTTFAVFMLNCQSGRNCTTIQFFAGFPDNRANPDSMNVWNRENRFGRGYISDKGSARIEMDVDMDAGGMSQPLLDDNVSVWTAAMAKFKSTFSK